MSRGSCLCGGVAFEASDSIELRNCHCSRCRKARGAAFATNLFVPAAAFRWLRGENLVVTYRLPNTLRFGNSFCRVCGIHAFYVPRSDPDKIDVNVRCLDSVDLASLTPKSFDGRNWEASMQQHVPWR